MSWENDDRGKPCKWLKQFIITAEEMIKGGPDLEKKKKQAMDAMAECIAAVNELVQTGEFVVIVYPESLHERQMDTGAHVYTIRARVRWVTPEAKANRERNLKAMFDAADDEYEKIMTERAGGKPN